MITRTEVGKIAVLRANAVGDFIVALPALEALRQYYPGAEIVLLGRRWHSTFLEGRRGPVDRTVVVPYCHGIYDPPSGRIVPGDLKRFFLSMERERFDLAFQLHGGGRNSNRFVRNLGAGMTIGARTPDAPQLDRWVPYRPFQNEKLRLLEIVSLTGAKPASLEPRLSITPKDFTEAERLVPENGKPVVVINPGSRDPRRRWPAGNFSAVADALAGAGAEIVINGDLEDLAVAGETLAAMRKAAQSVCGSLSLGGLAALLSRSKLLVSNDSGPFHLAAAVGTPVVGLFWCGNVHTYGPTNCRTTALHISWRTNCPVCGAHCIQGPGCGHQESFISDISTEEVTESALSLLKGEGTFDA